MDASESSDLKAKFHERGKKKQLTIKPKELQ